MFAPLCILTKAAVTPPQIQWEKTYGGIEGNVVVQTVDGGYAILGRAGDPLQGGYTNLTDVLIKTDSEGNLLWNKTYSIANYPSML